MWIDGGANPNEMHWNQNGREWDKDKQEENINGQTYNFEPMGKLMYD